MEDALRKNTHELSALLPQLVELERQLSAAAQLVGGAFN